MKHRKSVGRILGGTLAILMGANLAFAAAVWAVSHVVGEPVLGRPRVVERQVYLKAELEGADRFEVRDNNPSQLRSPIILNHIQVIHNDEGSPLTAIIGLELDITLPCYPVSIPIGTDGDVLRAIEASDTGCAGSVDRGGPLGSDLNLAAPRYIIVYFNAAGANRDYVLVGVLSYPGSEIALRAILD